MQVVLVQHQPEHREVSIETGGIWLDILGETLSIRHDDDDETPSTIVWLGDDGWHHSEAGQDVLYADIFIRTTEGITKS